LIKLIYIVKYIINNTNIKLTFSFHKLGIR